MESATEVRVWKALSDPSRRRLLELLRLGPETTGALCEAFEMSRYGVMKHLSVLHDADLVTVRREGRQRFNHLNAAPLQRIHRRFVRQFAERSASMLLDLEDHLSAADAASDQPEEPMMQNNHSFHIVQELRYAASQGKVWESLTKDIGKWWRFHVGPDDSRITLDGRVGGQFIERWGDGEGELYATVTFLKKGTKITLEGAMGMAGPGYSKFSFALEPDGEGTKVELNHYCHGTRSEEAEARYREGWAELLGTCLRQFVEGEKT